MQGRDDWSVMAEGGSCDCLFATWDTGCLGGGIQFTLIQG